MTITGSVSEGTGLSLFGGARLPPQPACLRSLARAEAWLRDASLDWRQFATRIRFAAEGYARRTLAIEDGWEIALCCWLPGQASALHDHGLSVGVVRLLAGELTETRYRVSGCELIEGLPRTFVEGETMCEERDVFHRVIASGSAPAISLHLYNPPLLRGALRH